VSFAINRYCYISARRLPPFFDHNYRIAYSKVEMVRHYSEIQHPAARECIRKYLPDLNLEVHHDGDLPARSGIGSSSAFAVGMINALNALKGNQLSKRDLAYQAIIMEHEVLRENVGWQDQIACALGGMNLIEFGPGKSWRTERIVLSESFETELCSRIALVYTGFTRNSTDISSGLISSIENKAMEIQRLIDLASACVEVLKSEGDLDNIGEMLNESWALKKKTNHLSTSSSLDSWYQKGMESGALGGKVIGAGGGGFMLFWLRAGGREEFIRKFAPSVIVPISISHSGSTVIYSVSDEL
jgi:D-glycero-alpha-D-manno-heptose-7-phosphate kinase